MKGDGRERASEREWNVETETDRRTGSADRQTAHSSTSSSSSKVGTGYGVAGAGFPVPANRAPLKHGQLNRGVEDERRTHASTAAAAAATQQSCMGSWAVPIVRSGLAMATNTSSTS